MTSSLVIILAFAAAFAAAVACKLFLGEQWMIFGAAAAGGLSALASERMTSLGEIRYLLVGVWVGVCVYVAGNYFGA